MELMLEDNVFHMKEISQLEDAIEKLEKIDGIVEKYVFDLIKRTVKGWL